MSCKYRQFKDMSGIAYVSGDSFAHFSHNRYRPYHKKLQKKQIAFHNDLLAYSIADGIDEEGDVNYREKELGINKNIHQIDLHHEFDPYKD